MKVKVWNDGPVDWVEEFKGDVITIPRGEYIDMTRSRAVKFLSQFAPFEKVVQGQSRPNPKKLRIEADPEEDAKRKDQPLRFTCTADDTRYRTQEGLKNHEAALARASSGKRKRASNG